MKTLGRWASSAVVLVHAVPSAFAAAPTEAEKQARRSFQAAEAHFRAGRYVDALAAYQEGYDQAPLPGFLINIAQCHRRLGDLPKARATYQKFVMVAPDSPHVPEVKNLIQELDRLLADLDAAAAAKPAGPPTSPGPVASASTSTSTSTTASTLSLAAPAPAPTSPRLVDAPRPVVATAAEDAAPAPAATSATGTRWWLWGLAGAAVVAGGTVAAFALGSSSTKTLHEGSLGALRR